MRASGLLSDVQLYEEYPSRYGADVEPPAPLDPRRLADRRLAAAARARRRGARARVRNPLSALSRWKIFDNLRRSLVPAALTLLLLLGWTVAAARLVLDAGGARRSCSLPPLIASLLDLVAQARRRAAAPAPRAAAMRSARPQLRADGVHARVPAVRGVVQPRRDRAHRWRMLVTRRRLLEWNPSQRGRRRRRTAPTRSPRSCRRRCGSRPSLAVARGMLLAARRPDRAAGRRAVLLLWFVSPAIAWWISRPLPRRDASLDDRADRCSCASSRAGPGRSSRRSSAPDDHWLPPDNFQEHPVAVVAHRTSPTNIGLSLLANLTAYDFGYMPAGQLIERTAQRARHDGDAGALSRATSTTGTTRRRCKPLLAALRLVGGQRQPRRPPADAAAGPARDCRSTRYSGRACSTGSDDTLRVLADAAAPAASPRIRATADAISNPRTTRSRARSPRCMTLARRGSRNRPPKPCASLDAPAGAAPQNDAHWWAQALARQCRGALDELALLAPWLALPAPTARLRRALAPLENPTLRELAAATRSACMQWRRTRARGDARGAANGWTRSVGTSPPPRAARASASARSSAWRCWLANSRGWTTTSSTTPARHLLAIGYNVGERRRDASYYDLLASEARLASFVAIAQGQLPQESWFALGRLLTTTGGEPVLLSWSGSMFEYLMPLLVMPTYENTLLDQTYRAAVDAADRVRPAARRAVGHLGIAATTRRRAAQLPVPRVRRAGPGLEARPRRGPRRSRPTRRRWR